MPPSRSWDGNYWAEIPRRENMEDDNGISNVRVYEGRYDSSGVVPGCAASVKAVPLPTRGQAHPDTSNLLVRKISRRQLGSSTQWEASVVYLPRVSGTWSTSGAAFSILPRSWSIGGELLQFAGSGDWYYVTGTGTNDPILGEVPAFKKLATGRLVIQEVVTDIQAARTRAKAAINTKNAVAFEGAAVGDMLYLGFESEEFVNDSGDVRWRLRHNFSERYIPGSSQGWERVLRDDTGAWVFINQSPGVSDPEPIYPSSSFSQIFGTS
jgi:hypothetical protein